ncbi:hypothetical protein LG634_36320 [Streptomyces bambusae]|uniref:hypothetical protein n=1 Tax=Streptomyces bambusae TaxID=1550616 RepID=UPI001CFF5C07|nr:hypothetical protein [Streptomyces bambusae]MCB5170252.1 hypothetical protein [Streptomyces bambusae]
MACLDSISVLPAAAAHPMANPGFGKRHAPDQLPRTGEQFAHLSKDEAALAWFIDRLPEGAAIDHKTLSAVTPGLGQAGCRTLLHLLMDAGHLCQFREHLVRPQSARWVTRTYFSRTARDRDWWLAFCRSIKAKPHRLPPREEAYKALAELRETDPELALSADECDQLAPLAEAWLARDPDVPRLVRTLTAGLPRPVHNPAALLRKRLETKMPPEPTPEPEPDDFDEDDDWVVGRRIMACFFCDADELTATIINSTCARCLLDINCDHCKTLHESASTTRTLQTFRPATPTPTEVHRFADIVREAGGLLPRGRE